MGKIDLSKDISFKDLKNISFKSKSAKQKKMVVSTKKGINLARKEKKKTNVFAIVGAAAAGIAIIALVAIFGFYKPSIALKNAQSENDEASIAFLQAQKIAAEYDATLEQYHAYSMEWYNNDTSGRYVSVPREKILKMIDEKVYPKGTMTGLHISGNTISLAMKDMSLPEVTAMISDIEQESFVTSCILQNASSQPTTVITKDENGKEVVTTGPDTVVFSISINLTTKKEAAE